MMKLLALCIAVAAVFGSGEATDQIPGSPAEISVDDPGVLSAAQFATCVISEGYGGSKQLGLIQVMKAKSQVVQGTLYTLTLAAGRTNCPKGSQDKAQQCIVPPEAKDSKDADYNECEVTVWDRPWLTPRFNNTKLKCNKPNTNEAV